MAAPKKSKKPVKKSKKPTTKSVKKSRKPATKTRTRTPTKRPITKQKSTTRQKANKKPAPAPKLGPFEREGELTWAVLAPIDASDMEARIVAIQNKRMPFRFDDEDDEPEPRHWCVLSGKNGYAAMIDTHYGNASGEDAYAAALSKALGKTVYALSFGGYNDPDKGLPYIEQYVKGKKQLIWMADSYDDEYPTSSLETVDGPKGVPSNDPFEFASAFGFDLRPYYD
ncbi:MAG TPA: hypothetical protein VIV40_32545 [Kofleriaceae bacterium]